MLKSLLEQFKGLNPRIGGLAGLPKALLLVVLLIGILVGAISSTGPISWSSLMPAGTGSQAQGRVQEQEAAVDQLDMYRQQLREIDSSFGALLKQLPNRSQMDALAVDINQAGLGRGLQFDCSSRHR